MRLSPVLAVLAGCAGLGFAQESFTVGPRALGMGGTGVAATDDLPAQYYNPAAFGFFAYQPPAEEQSDKGPLSVDNNALWRKDWGAEADFTFGARIHQDFAKHINTLKKYWDDGTIDRLGTTGLSGSQAQINADALALVDALNALNNLSDPDNAVTADATAGFSVRIKHFGLGVRTYSQVSGRLQSIDLTNIGVNTGGGNLDTQLTTVTPPGSGSVFTPSQLATLGGSFSPGNVTTLDQLAAQAGVTSAETDLLVSALVAAQAGGGTLDQNTSALRMYGVNVMEIPLSFGWAFNENLAIGGNLKAMIGRVYGTDLLVFDDNVEEAIRHADENYQQTVTWGVDLAVMFRMKMLNLGLTARNLNSPTFDGPTVGIIKYKDYKIEPTATLGAAFIPWETVTIAADLDLIESETVLSSYKSQYARLGAEWDIARVVALRAGYSQNLAEDDIGCLVHAGIGVNLYLLRIDLAGAMALKTTEYDGNTVPREARVGLQLATDW
jgi:F plasmid transfer operon, TraF, protein